MATPHTDRALNDLHALISKLLEERKELLAALRDLIDFDDLDSVLDQQTDVRLRVARQEAWDRARSALDKAEGIA